MAINKLPFSAKECSGRNGIKPEIQCGTYTIASLKQGLYKGCLKNGTYKNVD